MNETLAIEKSIDVKLDELEVMLLQDDEECEVVHEFTQGLYSREVAMLAGRGIVSKVHRFEHQFAVLRGSALVKVNDEDWVLIQAPFVGKTDAGTRRCLYILQDCSWITFHPTNKKTVEEVEKEIIEPHINSILGDELDSIRKLKMIYNV